VGTEAASKRGGGRHVTAAWPQTIAGVAATLFAAVAFMYLTLPDVRVLAHSNPSTTAFMELRAREGQREGHPVRRRYQWVPYRQISPNLKRAVLVAEDGAFWEHDGIDLEQIKESIETAIEKGDAPRGASTITQQLAKNLYLSPSRNPLRKFEELIITRRLEATLPKARILELYLNVVEWGEGVWGAEAAARHYFGVSASALSPQQAALLAGALINPVRYSPGHPPKRLLRRQQVILSRMATVDPPSAGMEAAQPRRAAWPAEDEPLAEVPPAPRPGEILPHDTSEAPAR
jgi:monofunctional biosynthetic peptidoglycan transglycosylase